MSFPGDGQSGSVRFGHADQLWADFPQLAAGVAYVDGVTPDADVDALVEQHVATARSRLARTPEGELPEIQAWRRAFSQLGLKPTRYRCAAEALLRRLRKEGSLPRIHPLVDLCNAVSAASAIPVAALDLAQVTGNLEVRRARGDERYLTFSGAEEQPEPGEVIYADDAGHAHARRWTNRQSGRSAVRPATASVLIVTEALHASAQADVEQLISQLAHDVGASWSTSPATAMLTRDAPDFAVPPPASSAR